MPLPAFPRSNEWSPPPETSQGPPVAGEGRVCSTSKQRETYNTEKEILTAVGVRTPPRFRADTTEVKAKASSSESRLFPTLPSEGVRTSGTFQALREKRRLGPSTSALIWSWGKRSPEPRPATLQSLPGGELGGLYCQPRRGALDIYQSHDLVKQEPPKDQAAQSKCQQEIRCWLCHLLCHSSHRPRNTWTL